jgi:glycosyltransferase involved in cell wall biosynthesis
MTTPSAQPPIDVCLVLEGTYPYVLGGVASWVHQLVAGLPEVRFGLLCLVADEQAPRQDRYRVPANVVWRQDVPIFGPAGARVRPKEPGPALMQAVADFHDRPTSASRCPVFGRIEALLRGKADLAAGILASKAAWDFLVRLYRERRRDVPLQDYFWTWRAIHAPLMRMMAVELPDARVFHSTSTGYGGLLTAIAKLRLGAGTAITEHGLFTREREMEIYMADWIYRAPEGRANVEHERFFKGWWRSKFNAMGDLAYRHADRVVTLHEANRKIQVAQGAPADRLEIVPNGIYPDAYAALRRPRDWSGRPFRVGFIGRVVPIKDVKTFLRALQLAGREIPLEAFVLGPFDEAPEYYESCRALAQALGLAGRIHFPGKVDVKAWLPDLDTVVLTSISESQPLVILEAAAAGIPCISTDVGSCRELLEGRTPEDRALGRSGFLTPAVSPEATARAIVDLARDPAAYAAMSAAGIARVERYYRQDDVYDYYRRLYLDLGSAAAAKRAA